jgi:AraC family transcriptional regulator of adaptative response/methylated-DNA-[protein]-cysteine methyltransferase
MSAKLSITRFETPLGEMLAAASQDALVFLEFTNPERLERQLPRLRKSSGAELLPELTEVLMRTQQELTAYFAGMRQRFTLKLAPFGTPFQQRVWQILQDIPFGATRTYGQQADTFGDRLAIRAVAKANGDNPIAIIIPCHRVIGADGKLTGYGGGLWRKQWLLDHERGELQLFPT